jgi:tetratricopeptide (TPR) repeat protein
MRALTALAILMIAACAAPSLPAAEAAEDLDEVGRRASEALAGGDFDRTREILLAALPLADTPEERFRIYQTIGGLFTLEEDRGPEAREAFRSALAVEGIDPDKRFWVYTLIASTWETEDKPAEVRATYVQALQENLSPPVRRTGLADLAAAWRAEGELEKAKSTYADLLKDAEAAGDSEWVAHAHNSIGAILTEEGSFAAAIEAYEEALCARGGSEVPICLNLGKALIGLKRYSDARLVLAAVAENKHLPPFSIETALLLTADALKGEGKPDEAEQVREQASKAHAATEASPKLDPDSEQALRISCRVASFLAIGRFYLDNGDKDNARAALARIVEMEDAPAKDREAARALLDATN